MKKVININFQGRVVPIEENAYDILQKYVDSLKKYFANEEGKDEIINDIESRIAELFAETLKKGSTCISDDDVNNIINSMGRPEDFDGEEEKVKTQLGTEEKTNNTNQQQAAFTSNVNRRLYRDENNKVLGGVCSGIANYFGIEPLIVRIIAVVIFGIFFIPYLILWVAVPSSATQVIGSVRKRLFRDTDDKIIAGVASGLGHYFGVNPWIPRILFLIPFLSFVTRWSSWGMFDFPHFVSLSFSPGATILYIILWLILPEAITSADKLEMRGERVDLNSIKQTIQTDMEGFKNRAEKFGEELKNKAEAFSKDFTPKAQQFGNETAYVAKKASRGFGDVIALIAKIFAYFILAVVLFSIVAALFAVGVTFIGLSPAAEYIINDGWQSVFAWGSLLLFIWVPIIGIITWIIRRIIKAKNNNIMRYSFVAIWLVGLFCTIGLAVSLRNDFRYKSAPNEQQFTLNNPTVNKLEVHLSGGKYFTDKKTFKIEPFHFLEDDTVYVPNTRIRIVRSANDSFQVNILKVSNGYSKQQANKLADKIEYGMNQKDTILSLYKGIAINKDDKFRNQRIIITIAVPLGKKIKIDEKIGWHNDVHIDFNDDNWRWRGDYSEDGEYYWESDKEYIMTEKGLERTNKSAFEDEDNNSDNLEKYKRSREELEREIEEQQREIEEKKRELQRSLEDKQRELELKKNELKKEIDTVTRYKYQKAVADSKQKDKKNKCSSNDLTELSSRVYMLQVAG